MGFFNKVTIKPFPKVGSNNQWDIEVEYEASFSDEEVRSGARFREGFLVFELDDTSADDKLTDNVVGVQEFVATNTTMTRTMKHTIDGAVLDTELGAEEIYAIARLRHLSEAGQHVEVKNSQVAPISP